MMRSDIVKMYKDVHSWVGIIAGLALFIAFYAGSITMFEEPLKRWASPPSELAPPVSLAETPRLIEATLAAHPDAKADIRSTSRRGRKTCAHVVDGVAGDAGAARRRRLIRQVLRLTDRWRW
ncbi:MAG: PepSY-associated TM helix domain-containing protein [Parvularculaceae bacterium]